MLFFTMIVISFCGVKSHISSVPVPPEDPPMDLLDDVIWGPTGLSQEVSPRRVYGP
jgi:hypothetical protein